ncbi:ROK family protein [Planctomicrobium sp. SH668]|uniref:ROK family transcriptional regulator n=1 Tax=Planctomicrobium sp. SH668 TaxID=3448126 RepID=UPI003F5C30A6
MSARVEPTLLRKLNERRVLELIQQQGPVSRATVTRISGLSAPTVSKAVASLLDVGLLEEIDAPSTSFGRPAKLVKLAVNSTSVMGVVIDPQECWVVASGLDGQLRTDRMKSFDTPHTYQELILKVTESIRQLKEEGTSEILGVGISVPGLKHKHLNKVVFSPNLHLLDGQSPGRDIETLTKLKCHVVQETHGLCIGEAMFGGAQGRSDFAMLDISTGLGLGVMSGGRLLSGNSGMAGELGHITVDRNGPECGCGNRGCLETLATDAALARMISAKLGRQIGILEVVQGVRANEFDATQELEFVAEYIAIAFAAVINIFNPTALFVHGALFQASDDLFRKAVEQAAVRALSPSLSDCKIIQARGSKRQAAIAAIIQHLTQSWAPTLS